MTPTELRQVLEQLAMSQQATARALGYNVRTMRRWVLGEIAVPRRVEIALCMMLKAHLQRERARAARAKRRAARVQ